MTTPANPGAALLSLFEESGCERVDTPILQPLELFLDLSGEDIRRRLFITQDRTGTDLCLRPEWTIPVCRQHVEGGRARADYCYLGPVFRHRGEGPGEFLQVGAESIGRPDLAAADADALGLALDGFGLLYSTACEIRIGDLGLLSAIADELGLAPRPRRRLRRALAGGGRTVALAPPARANGRDYEGLIAAIEGQDPKAARAFVEDVISIAGIAPVGGRTAAEIAARFLAKAGTGSTDLSDRARRVLERYLAIAGHPDEALAQMRALAREESLGIGQALDRFEDRTGFMAARGVDLSRVRFAADFARTLDYYTGFIFELRRSQEPAGWYVAAGGRYDRLFEHLHEGGPVPAVGCSFWLDRAPGGRA